MRSGLIVALFALLSTEGLSAHLKVQKNAHKDSYNPLDMMRLTTGDWTAALPT